MKYSISLIVLALVIFLNLSSEVDGKRKHKSLGTELADMVMSGWNGFTKTLGNNGRKSYAYWHHKKDKNGKWHRRKYARSDSSESAETSESSSRSSERSSRRRHSRRKSSESKSSSSSRSDEKFREKNDVYVSKLPKKNSRGDGGNFVGRVGNEEESLVAQALMYFIDNNGCQNATSLLKFMASYNADMAKDKSILNEQENFILKQMSGLAQQQLDQCPQNC